jgi:Zn-dependent protease/predicted transcriptional regulator
MNRNTIRLGRILGIPIGLDYSWFLVFALMTWTLAASYFPAEFSHWPVAEYWLVGAATAVMLFASVLLHELGHSVIALRYKVPVRSITLFIFGGVAQIESEPPSPPAEFWIAVAGPFVSFLLAGIFAALQRAAGAAEPLLALAKYLAYINGALGLFNLIPGFPLDGGRVFRAVVWGATHNLHRATLIAANVGRVIAFLFIGYGVWQVFTGNVGNGLWIAFIGWFLVTAASAQLQQERVEGLLAGHRVVEAMRRDYTSVDAGTTLEAVVDQHIIGSGRRSVVVGRDGSVAGLLTVHRIKEIPRSTWPTTPVAAAMIPLDQMKRIRPDAEMTSALKEMDRDGVNQLPVMDGGHLEGLLSRDDVISFLRTLTELGA